MITEFRRRQALQRSAPAPKPAAPTTTSDAPGETTLRIFDDREDRLEVWEVDKDGKKVRIRGNFLERDLAVKYVYGALRATV